MSARWITGIACVAIGLAAGAFLSGGSPATATHQVSHTVHRAQGVAGLDRAELVSVIRQELARERGATPVAPVAAPIETAEQARERMTDEEVAHADNASRVLRGAIARGQWTLEDRSALAAEVAQLPPAVQAELGGQLAVALNKGELVLDGDWLPL